MIEVLVVSSTMQSIICMATSTVSSLSFVDTTSDDNVARAME